MDGWVCTVLLFRRRERSVGEDGVVLLSSFLDIFMAPHSRSIVNQCDSLSLCLLPGTKLARSMVCSARSTIL